MRQAYRTALREWTRNMATVVRQAAKRTYHAESNRQETMCYGLRCVD